MIPRLFTPLIPAVGETVQLDAPAAHHALRVLRLGAGASVELFDGRGGAARASVLSTSAATALVELLLPSMPEPTLRLYLAQCISAADKMDWTIEKAVELGAAAIVPLQSHKATVKLTPERGAKRREHWQRLILAASAQCGRHHLPRLDEVMRLQDWLKQPLPVAHGLRFLLDPRATRSLSAALAGHETAGAAPDEAIRSAGIWMLCGPESGFSDEEYRQACEAGWMPAALGPRVLRTETAGLVALSIVQARWGDLR